MQKETTVGALGTAHFVVQLEVIKLARGLDVSAVLLIYQHAIFYRPVEFPGAADGFPTVEILAVEERLRIAPIGRSSPLQFRRGHTHHRNGLIAMLQNTGDFPIRGVKVQRCGGVSLTGLVDGHGHVSLTDLGMTRREPRGLFGALEENFQFALFLAHAEPTGFKFTVPRLAEGNVPTPP